MKKRILITGASRGIGRAIALYLAEKMQEIELVLTFNKNEVAANATLDEVQKFGVPARLLKIDIRDRDACRDALEKEIAANGVFFGIVCNAGINADATFPMMDDAAWDDVLRTNLDGFYNVLRPLVLPMVQARTQGRIVTISSVSGIIGNRGQVNYSAAKAGIIGATKALAVELARHKITVNCVAPGAIETDMTAELDPLVVAEIKKAIPVRRLGTGREVASAVAYLLSDDAAYVTRQVISVNGGLI